MSKSILIEYLDSAALSLKNKRKSTEKRIVVGNAFKSFGAKVKIES